MHLPTSVCQNQSIQESCLKSHLLHDLHSDTHIPFFWLRARGMDALFELESIGHLLCLCSIHIGEEQECQPQLLARDFDIPPLFSAHSQRGHAPSNIHTDKSGCQGDDQFLRPWAPYIERCGSHPFIRLRASSGPSSALYVTAQNTLESSAGVSSPFPGCTGLAPSCLSLLVQLPPPPPSFLLSARL